MLSVAGVEVKELRDWVDIEGVGWVGNGKVSFPWDPGIDWSEVEGVEGEGDVEIVVGEVEVQVGWDPGLGEGTVVFVVGGSIGTSGVVSSVVDFPVKSISDGNWTNSEEGVGNSVEDAVGLIENVCIDSGKSEENGGGVFHLKIINYKNPKYPQLNRLLGV